MNNKHRNETFPCPDKQRKQTGDLECTGRVCAVFADIQTNACIKMTMQCVERTLSNGRKTAFHTLYTVVQGETNKLDEIAVANGVTCKQLPCACDAEHTKKAMHGLNEDIQFHKRLSSKQKHTRNEQKMWFGCNRVFHLSNDFIKYTIL